MKGKEIETWTWVDGADGSSLRHLFLFGKMPPHCVIVLFSHLTRQNGGRVVTQSEAWMLLEDD